ncbi:3-isopropylmalate dehydrogenase [Kytococcus sp. Marseille-QA3725]
MAHHDLAIIGGDGIGPEVTEQALRVLDAVEARFDLTTTRTHYPLGAEHHQRTGEVLTDELADRLRSHDAIVFGAVGHPDVPSGVLERGIILALRGEMRQAVNLRPVRLYPGVTSPVAGLCPQDCDLVVVRENTEGAYASPGSAVHRGAPAHTAVQESTTTWFATERAVRYAFALAEQRRGRVTLCHKTNVLVEAGRLWLDVMEHVAADHPQVQWDYVHVDAMCMHLPTDPSRFDVVVTDNLFGDIVTDLGAVVQGGIGVAASGNLNLVGDAPSMFEPVHGSAPDIAGQGRANPVGAVLSLGLCLAHLGEGEAAAAVERAAVRVLGAPGSQDHAGGTGSAEWGDRVLAALGEDDGTELEGGSLMQQMAALRRS